MLHTNFVSKKGGTRNNIIKVKKIGNKNKNRELDYLIYKRKADDLYVSSLNTEDKEKLHNDSGSERLKKDSELAMNVLHFKNKEPLVANIPENHQVKDNENRVIRKSIGGSRKTRKLLPKLRKISYKNKKHHYKLKDPFRKRKLAIHEGVNREAKEKQEN